MRSLILYGFILLAVAVQAQTDTSTFRSYDKKLRIFEQTQKNVSSSNSEFQILIIEKDSMYNTLSRNQIREKLETGNYKLFIINDRDSINKIIADKIKAIFILTPNGVIKKSSR